MKKVNAKGYTYNRRTIRKACTLVGWARRMGFDIVESGGGPNSGWVRMFNLRRADHLLDRIGGYVYRPSTISRGAVGLQIEYTWTAASGRKECVMTYTGWRVQSNPEWADVRPAAAVVS